MRYDSNIKDTASLSFFKAFYPLLFQGETVQQAFDSAKASVHDRFRGQPGAWARAVAGISSAVAHGGGAPSDSSGLQRRQARYPAASAASALSKNSTFARSGFRAGHTGRQKMPVVRTPTKKMPSNVASRRRSAEYISAVVGSISQI